MLVTLLISIGLIFGTNVASASSEEPHIDNHSFITFASSYKISDNDIESASEYDREMLIAEATSIDSDKGI